VDETLTILRLENEVLKRDNAELRLLVEQLQDEISLLKGGKCSRTSSTSPSQDIGRSNHISLRALSVRKSGGQPGHTGYALPMSETPNEVVDHHPCICEHCGEDLRMVASASFTRRQLAVIEPVEILIFHRYLRSIPNIALI
jgi:hypothetical protein